MNEVSTIFTDLTQLKPWNFHYFQWISFRSGSQNFAWDCFLTTRRFCTENLRWPSALPGDLHRGKQRKLHKTSLIWAFKAAGHPFSGGCQVLHFWCKDAGACRLFSACFYPRALVREFSTGANVAHHRRICDSPDYFCSCTDYRTHQGSNSHTFITQRKTFSSFRLGYAISQSSRPL